MYDFGLRQALSGYRLGYRLHQTNICPGCGRAHWMVGRITAECAFCATALPLVGGAASGSGVIRRHNVAMASPLAA